MRKINPYEHASVGVRVLDAAIVAMTALLGVIIGMHFNFWIE